MIIQCPCRDCTKETGRYSGCHDHCKKPEYIKWRTQQQELKSARDKERALFRDFQDMKAYSISRTKKLSGHKD